MRRLTIVAAADNRTPEQIIAADAGPEVQADAGERRRQARREAELQRKQTLQRGGRLSGPRDYGRERLDQAHQSPRCQHTKTNGGPCKAPALRGKEWCNFHSHVMNTHSYDYQPPLPEDAVSIQFGLSQVIRALAAKEYDTKTCALMLYALQLAGSNLKRFEAERMAEAVQSLPKFDVVTAMLKRIGLYDAADEREARLREAAEGLVSEEPGTEAKPESSTKPTASEG